MRSLAVLNLNGQKSKEEVMPANSSLVAMKPCTELGVLCNLVARPTYATALIGGRRHNDSLLRGALMARFGGYN